MPSGRILLVDDEKSFLFPMRLLLERQGYQVQAALTAREAFKRMSDAVYDAVVTDVNLNRDTGLDGFAVMEVAHSFYGGVRVIMISGDCDGALMERASREGADAFLFKPLSYRILLEQLADLGVCPAGCTSVGPKEG